MLIKRLNNGKQYDAIELTALDMLMIINEDQQSELLIDGEYEVVEMITVPKHEYDSLVKTQAFMEALEAAGIDNATAYEYGQDLFREWNPEYFDDEGDEI